MKLIKLLTLSPLISLLSLPGWSETIPMDELVTNPTDGLVYKKFTSDPFTGSTTPASEKPSKGYYKNGKKHGVWEHYHDNGLLHRKETYKDGKEECFWKMYDINGKLKFKNSYNLGYLINGVLKNYHKNGKLFLRGNYKVVTNYF
jgi:antitoxin component YwqK of YwqJK toxin-antitoxin module